ncbi:hypothetical protein KP509_20G045200 [Ceratopteris richardii]|uniref:Uncharacterized protein n=1 Tax=Ceratopteris richardii TaxID=49495 RepID=A0A8T2SFJ1_CERRI|nr:hypothetical protein KP509_20G045200 [Ceratopteris richardii]
MAITLQASALCFSPSKSNAEVSCGHISPFPASQFAGTSVRHQALIVPCKRKRRALGRARAGLPVISNVPIVGPLVNTLLSPLVLLAVYAYGGYRFMSGFSKTPYADTLTTKVGLTALWPVLFVISQKFRSNFKRAVQ